MVRLLLGSAAGLAAGYLVCRLIETHQYVTVTTGMSLSNPFTPLRTLALASGAVVSQVPATEYAANTGPGHF